LKPSILVIEDEPTLARLLSYNLNREGYDVTVAENGGDGLRLAVTQAFDLIILDIMLPGLNGFEVLSRMRERGVQKPVIILTARSAEDEIVRGLRMGADDYMTKPFGVDELLARVSAVLRRSGGRGAADGGSSRDETKIEIGDLVIYPKKYEVWAKGEPIALRPKEFEVLLYLIQRPGIVVTRDDLMNAVWGFDYIGGQRTVDVHVSSLRKKLEPGRHSLKIDSIRGVGYKLVPPRPDRP
jgi:two-component system alkaline phosphatase synthesis response regulator PhoP